MKGEGLHLMVYLTKQAMFVKSIFRPLFFTLILFAIVSTGCSHNLDIRYDPATIPSSKVASLEGVNIYLAPIEDIRENRNSQDLNTGMVGAAHTYASSETPIDLFKKALISKLSNYGINISDSKESSQGVLKGILKVFSGFTEMGFWSGTFRATASIDLELTSSEGKDILWNRNLRGDTKIGGLQYVSPDDFQRGMSEALTMAIDSLDSSPDFIKVVSNLSADQNFNISTARVSSSVSRGAGQPSTIKQRTTGGTGFLFNSQEFIVTNSHVVRGHDLIVVTFPHGEAIEAKIKSQDTQNDIAILKLAHPPSKSSSELKFGDSSKVRPGDKVFTIGYPSSSIMGKNQKITDGIISSVTGIGDDPSMFQVTVPIQPGNSGGPLFNEKGEVIGIITASLSDRAIDVIGATPQNVNYALKSAFIKNLLSTVPKTLISNRGITVIPSIPNNSLSDFFEQVSGNIVQVETKKKPVPQALPAS